jgi:hypothetical protein
LALVVRRVQQEEQVLPQAMADKLYGTRLLMQTAVKAGHLMQVFHRLRAVQVVLAAGKLRVEQVEQVEQTLLQPQTLAAVAGVLLAPMVLAVQAVQVFLQVLVLILRLVAAAVMVAVLLVLRVLPLPLAVARVVITHLAQVGALLEQQRVAVTLEQVVVAVLGRQEPATLVARVGLAQIWTLTLAAGAGAAREVPLL